ncbi:HAD hydrolase-like protein [Candidatus Pacearchaeota archaeon]|nr:HAD hydrolase-like protein [Candidatus Pacearchaeota archaeon]
MTILTVNKKELRKPMIAVSMSGVLISSKFWKEAHDFGMKELSKKVGDSSILKARDSPDYFKKVEEALEKIYPDLTLVERIKKRREIYFERVVNSIKRNLDIREDVTDCLWGLKENYRLALVTTNNEKTTYEILRFLTARDFFDVVEFSKDEEKDDKIEVMKRLIEKNGKPILFIEKSEKLKDFCEEGKIAYINFNVDLEGAIDLKSKIEEKLNLGGSDGN